MKNKNLTVRSQGPPRWLRYVIKRGDWEYWTGEEWSKNKDKALVYANLKQVTGDWRKLMAQEHADKPKLEFLALTHVTVQGDVTQEQLASYLSEHAKLTADPDHQPFEGSIDLTIDWESLEEIKNEV